MSNYTPTTEMIRRDYCYSNQRPDICGKDFGVEFDRWYAEEIRKAKEEVWDEVVNVLGTYPDGRRSPDTATFVLELDERNPYRKEQND